MKSAAARRPKGARSLLAASLAATSCAGVLGLDLEGFHHQAGGDGAGGAPAAPAPSQGRDGPVGGGSGGSEGTGGTGAEAGAGGEGGGQPGALCAGLVDPRGEGEACCAERVIACEPPADLPPLVCRPWSTASQLFYRVVGGGPCDPSGATPCFEARVRRAVSAWVEATQGQLTFKPWQGESGYIGFEAKRGACYAEVAPNFPPKVWADPDGASGCDQAALAHLLGHVLGLPHAFQRADRDRYLDIDPSRVPCGCEDDVLRPCGADFELASTFDYASVMLYPTGPHAEAPFFTDKRGTVLPRPSGPTPLDASAWFELRATRASYFPAASGSWQPFVALGLDVGASAPLDPALPGGASIHGQPAAAVVRVGGEDRLHLVVRGDDGYLYEKSTAVPWASSRAARAAFSSTAWAPIGGPVGSEAALASRDGSHLDVAVKRDGAFFVRSLDATDWVSLGAPPGAGSSSAPALVQLSPGVLLVLVRGPNDRLWTTQFDGGAPQPWVEHPLRIASRPAVASRGPSHLDLVALRAGPPQSVIHAMFDPSSCPAPDHWCEPEDLFGAPAAQSSPALALTPAGEPRIYARELGSFLTERAFDGGTLSWRPWDTLGGLLTTDPAAAAWPDDRITVYGVGTTRPSGDMNEPGKPTLFERTFYPGGYPATAP